VPRGLDGCRSRLLLRRTALLIWPRWRSGAGSSKSAVSATSTANPWLRAKKMWRVSMQHGFEFTRRATLLGGGTPLDLWANRAGGEAHYADEWKRSSFYHQYSLCLCTSQLYPCVSLRPNLLSLYLHPRPSLCPTVSHSSLSLPLEAGARRPLGLRRRFVRRVCA
jgi:hypothetical protein